MRTYRFAIVGGGYMAQRYMKILNAHPRATGAGVCGRGVDLEALVVDPAIDAVIICSPDATHPHYVTALMSSSKLILCEKPLARTEEEFAAVQQAVASSRATLVVGMNCRFRARVQDLKQRIEDGALARPRLVQATYASTVRPILDGQMKQWWLTYPPTIKPFLHGGAVHMIDALRYLFGEVVSLQCVDASDAIASALSGDTFVVLLRFAAGTLVNLTVTGTSFGPARFEIQVDAENASVDADNEYSAANDGHVSPKPLPAEDYRDLARQIDHVVAVMDGEASPLNTPDEAYRNFQVIRACERSLRSESWVEVPYAVFAER